MGGGYSESLFKARQVTARGFSVLVQMGAESRPTKKLV